VQKRGFEGRRTWRASVRGEKNETITVELVSAKRLAHLKNPPEVLDRKLGKASN